MANPSVTYTLANGNVIDADKFNTNYTDIINSLTDGTKSLTIDALTCGGAVALNGAVTLGNATGDDITVTGYVASHVIPKTTNTYDLGTTSLRYKDGWFAGNADITGTLNVAGGVVFNEASADVDFRVESNGNANMLFVDGGSDIVCIGASTGVGTLSVAGVSGAASATVKGMIQTISSENVGMALGYIAGSPYTSYIQGIDTRSGQAATFPVAINPNGGNVGIGTPSPGSLLTVTGPAAAAAQRQIEIVNRNSSNGATLAAMTFSYDGSGTVNSVPIIGFYASGLQGSIAFQSDATGVDYNVTSDSRLKTDLTEFDALALIEKTNPIEFSKIASPGFRHYGFLAQELYTAIPQAVRVGGDNVLENPWQVDHSKLVPVLTKAIQELSAKLTALEERIPA